MLICEEKIPFKSNLDTYLKRQALKVSRSAIEVHLNTTIATPPPVEGTSYRMGGLMELPGGFPLVHGVALGDELTRRPNIKLCVSTKALEITDAGLVVEDSAGVRTIPADTVIYAIGQKPLLEEALALSACAPEFYQIGDCVTPKNIYDTISAAHQVACDIGRF